MVVPRSITAFPCLRAWVVSAVPDIPLISPLFSAHHPPLFRDSGHGYNHCRRGGTHRPRAEKSGGGVMRKISLVVALAVAQLLLTSPPVTRGAQQPPSVPSTEPTAVARFTVYEDTSELDTLDAARAELESLTAPLPEAKRIYTHTYRAGHITTRVDSPGVPAAAAHAGLPQEKLIYSNTGGTKFLKLGIANVRVSDDLQTDAICGCDLSRYLVRVKGTVPHGVGEFSCTVSLHSICPSTPNGNVLIPGTDAIFTGLTDDSTDYHDLVVDVSLNPIPIDSTVWVRVTCDSSSAGWVGGAPAEIGVTSPYFFYPLTGCNSFLGPNFFSGFYSQVWVNDDPFSTCQTHNLVYASGPPLSILPGDNSRNQFADDFQTVIGLAGETCVLSGYDVASSGINVLYKVGTSLRLPDSTEAITGTETTFSAHSSYGLTIFRHVVDPTLDIEIPFSPLWLEWSVDTHSASLMLANGVALGASDPYYAITPSTLPGMPGPFHASGGFYFRVYCRGETPRGVCCREPASGADPVCRDDQLPRECMGRRWIKDGDCASDPFNPPCGFGACCTPQDICIDLPQADCAALGGVWSAQAVCSSPGFSCGLSVCRSSQGECNQSHDSPACNSKPCCDSVCSVDPTCCSGVWDEHCVRVAANAPGCANTPQGSSCSPGTYVPNIAAITVDANSEFSLDNTWSLTTRTFCCAAPAASSKSVIYLRFVATESSARIHTCDTALGDGTDSVLQFYSVGNDLSDYASCQTLQAVACNDDQFGCGTNGRMSELCIDGLVPGKTYYFALGAYSNHDRGIYRITVESPCGSAPDAGPCSPGTVQWVDPLNNSVVDGRQPFDLDAPEILQGPTSFTVLAPANMDEPACWKVCDTLGNPLQNEVIAVMDNGDGTQTLQLAYPMTYGASTRVTYADQATCPGTSGTFKFLPGDVDRSSYVSTFSDLYYFGSYCLDVEDTPDNLARCDINRSEVRTSEDLVRLIDLMNGAGAYFPMLNKSLTASAPPCE